MNSRLNLPFRKNCEGHFVDGKGNILAKNTGKGYIAFPGGGIDESEIPEEALIRETKEETGAIVEISEKIGSLNFIWGEDWATSEKQKLRYEKFQGEEMHFFIGKINEFIEEISEKIEDFWGEEKFMPIEEVIKIIEENAPYSQEIKHYREKQLEILKSLM